jgi:hypothetical protein
MNTPGWGQRKISSFSTGANNCLEAAHAPAGLVGIWDTKHRASGPLTFPASRWNAWLAAVAAGRLDG